MVVDCWRHACHERHLLDGISQWPGCAAGSDSDGSSLAIADYPFGKKEAALAADLFNKTGRRRGSRFDCLIAAKAIIAQADVATINHSDFKLFAPHGLKLAIVSSSLPSVN
ncbi:MAG TPA: hypothetical protein VGO59_17005 [Verrucomicrobiae bacterium]|jgi:hypothetical protein